MEGLMLHTGKAEAATFRDLEILPPPPSLGPWHKPVPHSELVAAIRAEAERRELIVRREVFGLSRDGAKLFATMDLARPGDSPRSIELPGSETDRGMMLGFRSANDQAFKLSGVAGSRVFVCDNMALSGDMFAWDKKHTTGLDLIEMIKRGFDRFLGQFKLLDLTLKRLEATPLNDGEAKVRIYDAFAAGVVPSRLFDDVHQLYFEPTDETPDTKPRTVMGLHNAFTRAIKQLSTTRAFAASIALGRVFGLRTKES